MDTLLSSSSVIVIAIGLILLIGLVVIVARTKNRLTFLEFIIGLIALICAVCWYELNSSLSPDETKSNFGLTLGLVATFCACLISVVFIEVHKSRLAKQK